MHCLRCFSLSPTISLLHLFSTRAWANRISTKCQVSSAILLSVCYHHNFSWCLLTGDSVSALMNPTPFNVDWRERRKFEPPRIDADLCQPRTKLSSSAYANKSSGVRFLLAFFITLFPFPEIISGSSSAYHFILPFRITWRDEKLSETNAFPWEKSKQKKTISIWSLVTS